MLAKPDEAAAEVEESSSLKAKADRNPDVSSDVSSDVLVGRVIADRLRIVARLAAGGMGVVYRAEQMPLGRTVAVKVLKVPHDAEDSSHFTERFLLEAATVANLKHPNTIILHDYGQVRDSVFYYAMEYVDGPTLTHFVKSSGPLAAATAIHIGQQICGSLSEAHRAGVIHRDLKPANVMLTNRPPNALFVKVLDFGLAKAIGPVDSADGDSAEDLTQKGMMLGTPRYMAPEQVRSAGVDHRTDVYAFGAVLFHMLVGSPPFLGKGFDVLRAHLQDPVPRLKDRHEEVDVTPRLEALVRRCLAKRKADRPASMEVVAEELAICAAEVGVYSTPLGLSSGASMIERSGLSGAYGSVSRRGAYSATFPSSAAGGRVAPLQAPVDPSDSYTGSSMTADRTAMLARPKPVIIGAVAGLSILGALALALWPSGASQEAAAAVPESRPATQAAAAPATPERESEQPTSPDGVALEGSAHDRTAGDALTAVASAPSLDVQPEQPLDAQPEPLDVQPEQPLDAHPEQPGGVEIRSAPAGARVYRGFDFVGETPLILPIPANERWRLRLKAEGYRDKRVSAYGDATSVHVQLEADRRASRGERTRTPRAAEPKDPPKPAWAPRRDNRNPWAQGR